jgi:glycosyltransferase involved in cell wall biosynthesis
MLVFVLFSTLQILKLNKREKIKLIHAQDTGYSGLAAILAGKMLNVPVVISSHGIRMFTLARILNGPLKSLQIAMEHAIDMLVCRKAGAIIAVSSFVRDYINALGVNKQKTYVIPVGIPLSEYNVNSQTDKYILENLKEMQAKTIIGFIGRLSAEKNPSVLLTAYSQIVQNLPASCLLFIGDGPLMNNLQKYAQLHGIADHVKFLGIRRDVPILMKIIDIFVIPSKVEGCPTVLLEAMSGGKAIIASNIPAIKEIVEDGKEALLFDPHNPKQLKDAIVKLYYNSELRRRLGEYAKKKAKQYDIDVVFPQIIEVYQEVLRNKF